MKRIPLNPEKDVPFMLYLPAITWQVLFLFVPLMVVFFFSFFRSGETFQFSLANYRALLDMQHLRIIIRSVTMSLGTMISTFLLAYPVAYFLALLAKRWKNFALFFVTLPFWSNFLVLIYSWFFLLENNGVINSFLMWTGAIQSPLDICHNIIAVFILMLYCYLPFMIMPIFTSLSRIDHRIFEASADLGARPWQTFTRITFPLSLPGIRTGALLVMVPAFGELAIPALMGKQWMVSSLITHYFFVVQDDGIGSALTMASGAILFLMIISIYYLLGLLIPRSARGNV
jgi:spermidine/putrescine transport system permease protein